MIVDEQLVENIESWHDTKCDSYDQCGCFGRLLACLRGEPDPYREFYRWPVYDFNVREPRIAEWRAMGRTEFTTDERMREATLRTYEDLCVHMFAPRAVTAPPDTILGVMQRIGAGGTGGSAS